MEDLITHDEGGVGPLSVFHPFPLLPRELRDMIWDFCLPRRVIQNWYCTVALERQFHLLEDPEPNEDQPLAARFTANNKSRVYYRCPLISRVCCEAREAALMHGRMRKSWCAGLGQEEMAREDHGIARGISWFDKKRDAIRIDYDDLRQTSDETNPPSEVLECAQDDPSIPLLIADFQNCLHRRARPINGSSSSTDTDTDTDTGTDTSEKVGSLLYHKFLNQREVVYFVTGQVSLPLTKEGRELAIKSGQFGLFGEGMMVVATKDVATVRDLTLSLFKDDPRDKDAQDNAFRDEEERIFQTDPNGQYPVIERSNYIVRLGMSNLVEFICEEAGHEIDGIDLVDQNGNLKMDHWLVKKLDIKLPSAVPVFTVELVPEL